MSRIMHPHFEAQDVMEHDFEDAWAYARSLFRAACQRADDTAVTLDSGVVKLAEEIGNRLALYDVKITAQLMEDLQKDSAFPDARQATASAITELIHASKTLQQAVRDFCELLQSAEEPQGMVPDADHQLQAALSHPNASGRSLEVTPQLAALTARCIFEQDASMAATLRAALDPGPDFQDDSSLSAVSLQQMLASAFSQLARLQRPEVAEEMMASGPQQREVLHKLLESGDLHDFYVALRGQPLEETSERERVLFAWRHGVSPALSESPGRSRFGIRRRRLSEPAFSSHMISSQPSSYTAIQKIARGIAIAFHTVLSQIRRAH